MENATHSYDEIREEKWHSTLAQRRQSVDQGYDPLCPYPSEPYSQKRYEPQYIRNGESEMAIFQRVHDWASSGSRPHHDHYPAYDYRTQHYSDDNYYGQKALGYGQNRPTLDHDYQRQSQRPEEPYL